MAGQVTLPRCEHNQRCRYVDGFWCEDCDTFFPKDGAVYRSGELLSTLWMVLHNISAESEQRGGPKITDALRMRDRIGIGVRHADHERLIRDAERVMRKHGVTADSANVG